MDSHASASESSPLLHQNDSPAKQKTTKSRLQQIRHSEALLLFAVSFCTLADNLIYGVVLPLLPLTLREYAHVPEELIQRWIWIALASFGTAQIACSALAALAVLRFPSVHKIMFVSLLALAVSILLYSLATHPLLVVGARIAQGASNAVVNVVGIVILIDRLGPESYGKSFGYIGTATAIGCVAGPVFGGLVYKLLGYVAVFVATAILVVLCALLILVIEGGDEPDKTQSKAAPDVVDAESQTPSQTEESGTPDASTGIAWRRIAGLRLGLCVLGLALSATIPASLDTILPLHAQKLFGWDPFRTGLIFLALIPGALFGPYIGSLGDRVGAKTPLILSCLLAASVMAAVSQVLRDSTSDKVLLIVACTLGGLAEPAFFSLCGAVVSDVVEAAMPQRQHPRARAVWSSVVVNYGASGGAVLATVVVGNARDSLGWTGANAIVGGMFGVGALAYLALL